MEKKKFNYIEKSLDLNKNLFPNKTIFNEIMNFNETFLKKWLRIVILLSIYFVATLFISMELKESIRYIVATTVIYFGLVVFIFGVIFINKEKSLIYKKQIKEINEDKEKYKYQIMLHQNYQKYNKKWNAIYIIVLLLSSFFSISLFISDLIESGNTSYAPIFIFFVVIFIIIIPVVFFNYYDFKKFIKKHLKSEQNNNI